MVEKRPAPPTATKRTSPPRKQKKPPRAKRKTLRRRIELPRNRRRRNPQRKSNSSEDHFDHSPTLERFLEEKGKKEQAAMVRRISDMVQVSYTRQKEPLGLGDAVLVAKDLVGDEPFAVLLGDVLIPGANPATKQLIDVYAATGVGAIAVEEVPKEKTQLYGIVAGEPAPQPPFGARLLRIRDVVEKPKPEKAPSNLGITGRYVLPPQIFDCLERTKPGTGNEIQLTDALRLLV